MSRKTSVGEIASPDPLVEELMATGREMSGATVMFHSAVAEAVGLSATEHKAMDILARTGPLTAGGLAEHTGLTTGAITGLVDRLEAAGFVRRVRDAADRRKVIVEPVLEVLHGVIGPIFREMGEAVGALYGGFEEAERRVLLDYQRRMTELLREETLRLRRRAVTSRDGS